MFKLKQVVRQGYKGNFMDPQWKGISDKYMQDDCSFSNINKIRYKGQVGGGDLTFQVAELEG